MPGCRLYDLRYRIDQPPGERPIRVSIGVEFRDHQPGKPGSGDKYAQGVDRFVVSEPALVQDVCRGEFSGVDHIDVEMNQILALPALQAVREPPGRFFWFCL